MERLGEGIVQERHLQQGVGEVQGPAPGEGPVRDVCDRGPDRPADPVVPISYPKDYSSKLASDVGSYYTLGIPEETDGFIDGRLDEAAMLSQMADIESERDRMFWLEFGRFMEGDGGVFAFVYDTSDRVQHVFWDEKAVAGGGQLSDPIVSYYVGKDRFIGEVLDRLDERTLLLVVSDHGFTSFERSVNVNNWLVENGYMVLSGKPEGDDDGALFNTWIGAGRRHIPSVSTRYTSTSGEGKAKAQWSRETGKRSWVKSRAVSGGSPTRSTGRIPCPGYSGGRTSIAADSSGRPRHDRGFQSGV